MKKFFITSVCLICLIGITSCDNGNDIESPTHDNIQITEHTHSYDSTVVAPTCTENGFTLHDCSLCDEQYSDSIVQPLGHNYEESIKDALCNQYQKKTFKCSICANSYEEILDIQGTIHTYTSTVTYPDKENGGYTTHSCKNCTESYVDNYTDPVDFSVGLAYIKKSGKYYVSGIGSCKDSEIIIPSVSEKGYRVAGIAENAFSNANVVSITVSDGVTDIQSKAFYGCTTLKSVSVPKNATLSENLFSNNPVLTTLTMPIKKPLAYYFRYASTAPDGYKLITQGDGSFSGTYYGLIPDSLQEINILNSPCDSALSGCDMITKISIPSDATSIGAAAFSGCTKLTDFVIPDSVRTIGASAFAKTSITSITIPKNTSFSTYDQYIFEDCSQLSEVTFLSQNSILPSYMFLNCVNLKQLQIPNSVTSLGGSFISGTSIEYFTIPNGVTEIYSHTFNGCTNLKEVILPQGLKVIEYGAFQGCTALEQIEMPTTLEKIGHEAFMGCSSLKKVILPSNLKVLDYAAFKNCTSLNHVELPATIEKISIDLFFGCSSLQKITLPDCVTLIQNSAFEGSGLVSITIPESVVRVGARIFANCKSLESVVFSSDNTPIENEMFLGATALQSIHIPKNVTEIPFRFCQGATALKTITFNEGLLVIKDDAFLGCTSIQSITLPSTLKSIWARSFKGCTSLQSVDFSGANMSEEASKQGVEWFADCTALSEIKNHDGLRYINASIFNNTPIQVVEDGMTIALGWLLKVSPEELPRVVVVPEGVTKIYDYVFSACNNIEEVILPEGVTFLGFRIFGESNGSSLVKLTFPDSLICISSDTICFLPQIEEIVVGTGLQKIDGNYFGNLKTIRFRGTIEEFKQMPWCEHSAVQSMTVICTNGTVEPTQE